MVYFKGRQLFKSATAKKYFREAAVQKVLNTM